MLFWTKLYLKLKHFLKNSLLSSEIVCQICKYFQLPEMIMSDKFPAKQIQNFAYLFAKYLET